MSRWYSANVLQALPGGRRLWRFSAKGSRFVFDGDKTLTLQEAPPAGAVGKTWQSLLRPKLNVAWLPPDKVFLRAVQLPGADAAEITSMVELQLEKLSPLPVTHIVWSLYLMPKAEGKPEVLQTVIVIIAARSYVEEFLGGIEEQGFLADRIEAPGLDQLLSVKMNEDGLWIFPGGPGEPALLAWHYGGAIQNLTLLPLPEGPERGEQLKAHVEQIAWAGELEGWLTGAPRIHLVAQPAVAGDWQPMLRSWADGGVETVPPAAPEELAARSAERTGNNGATTNLLPVEYSGRYHQQLVDRLWMRGLMTVAGIYIFGVLVYFGVLAGYTQTYKNELGSLAKLGPDYTNAVADQFQIGILTERQNLKYAALDCWKAVAETLPESMTLDHFYFTRNKVDVDGTGASGQQDDVYAFHDGLRQATDASHTNLLFADVKLLSITAQGADRIHWSFTCVPRISEDR
jgi:hypothetical protein